MKETRGNRLHIAFLGKMNTGKSSIINALFNREISIVSEVKGTTTDINQKAMELLPIGPISVMDTAGLDDCGYLGEKRVKKTLEVLDRTDAAVVVFDYTGVKECDLELFKTLKEMKIPVLSIINKSDTKEPDKSDIETIEKNSNHTIFTSAKCDKEIIGKIKQGLINILSEEQLTQKSLIGDIIGKNDTVVLVIPIDKEAPKGRIILPQVQTIRDILDNNAISVVCGVENLKKTIDNLKTPPKLVITDSQAFKEVNKTVDNKIPLTSFSIIFARIKGDLETFANGAKAIDNLDDNDKILICESCSHHPIEDDIGRVKIPNLIKKYSKKNVEFDHVSGHVFPNNIEQYKLIIHCGACMTNRREVLSRISHSNSKNVPITNYGIAIAKCLGILDTALKPFRN